MVRCLIRCFRGPHEPAQVPGESIPSSPVCHTEQASTTARNVLYSAGPTRPDALLASTLDMDRFVEPEQIDVPTITSLEEARQIILRLKTRVLELEGSVGQNAECTLMSLRQIRLPEQESKTGTTQVSTRRGNEPMPSVADSTRDSDLRDEHKSVPHLFCAYTKQELMELMGRTGKPAAAVLLQAVCEEDIGNVPAALLLDVDPAVGDSITGAPELVAALKNGSNAADFSQIACVERFPSYLRLRLYMMQACGARPRLACATATARALFKARTDRQLQYVLEGQVHQDAMLGMLLQEMLDEMLSAPVNRSSAVRTIDDDHSTIVMHSLSHFVNTSNPKVFPFVPVTMRGCGYKKTSGEVVPCIIFEFSPDSNQGAFLEHLQRDYTMMGHISAIITLFTLKGDVLHQNAGSIAYYGYQRRTALSKRAEKRTCGFAHANRNDRCISNGLGHGLDASTAAWLQRDERSVLMKLFQQAPPDALESMLESMVQGGAWRSILPVPASLASSNRPMASPGGLCDPLAGTLGMSPGAAYMGPDADNVFTIDELAYTGANVMSFAQPYDEPSVSNRPDAFEGSFALGTSGGNSATRGTYGGGASGQVHARSMRALKAVPEQSQEHERLSFALQRPTSPAEKDDLSGQSSTSNLKPSSRYIRSTSVTIDEDSTKPIKVPRRSTTFSSGPTGGIDHQARVTSGNGGAASFTSGVVACNSSPRMSRIRRRSGLPFGLDGIAAEALSQSTWGLFGNGIYENRHDRGACRGPGGADGEHAGDTRNSPGLHFTAASTVPIGAVSTAGVAASHGATGPVSGASEAAAAGTAITNVGPLFARRSETTSPSLISPSLSSQVDQWQQWQYRHSQWQDALQSQSQPSQASHLGHTAPGRMSNHPPAAWGSHQQQAGFSQSSSSVANQSRAHSSSRRGVVGMAGAMDGTGGDAGNGIHRQSSVESMAQRQRSAALGDSTASPTARSTPTPSAGSVVSPQPSAHQHTDSNIMGCTTFVATAGNAPLDPLHVRSSTLLPPSQLSRFSPSSPAGSPLLALAPPPGGAGGSHAATAIISALKADSSIAPPHRSSSASLVSAPLQQGLQKLFSVSASAPAAEASVSVRGADAGAIGAVSVNLTAKQIHITGAASCSMRRAPMRQSERSNPNLVLPRVGSASMTSKAVKSATSFSFGCKGPGSGAHHPRPLVRMMSFLNATPSMSVQSPPPQQQQPQQPQQPQQQQQQPLLPSQGHGYNNSATGHGSAAQQRQITRRAPSGQFINMLDPVIRTGSSKIVAVATGDSGIGAVGLGGVSSQSGSRHPPSTFICGSAGLRRQSVRAPSGAALIHQSSVDESSSLAVLTTMATLGNSREAAGEHRGGPNYHACSAPEIELPQTYHEVTATPFLDPVSKAQVVMVVQTDVTARVQLERRLADVMEAEHKLLENIFPRHVLEHIAHSAAVNQERASQFNLRMLSEMPDLTKTATDHPQVTILFADIVGFTSMCKEVPAKMVMKFLNDLYTRFDSLLDIYGVYKVETIGDCYMVAGGLISKDADGFAAVRKDSCDNLQAWRVLSFAKAMLRDAQKVILPTTNEPVKLRVGIHTGSVVSGVVGTRMPRFCLFGDTINTASRMESTCPYGRIQVSAATHALVPNEDWEPTGGVQVKGKGIMETYLLKQTPVVALPNNLACASLSTPGLPDPALTHGSSSALRLGPRSPANCSGVASGAQGSGGICSAAGGSTNVSASVAHGVISTVTEKVPEANVPTTLPSAAAQNGTGGAPRDASRLGSSRGGGGGKNPSFLFNTVW